MNRQRPFTLLLLLAYIVFPSLFSWVTNPTDLWYKPYIVWLLVIVTAFLIVNQKRDRDA